MRTGAGDRFNSDPDQTRLRPQEKLAHWRPLFAQDRVAHNSQNAATSVAEGGAGMRYNRVRQDFVQSAVVTDEGRPFYVPFGLEDRGDAEYSVANGNLGLKPKEAVLVASAQEYPNSPTERRNAEAAGLLGEFSWQLYGVDADGTQWSETVLTPPIPKQAIVDLLGASSLFTGSPTDETDLDKLSAADIMNYCNDHGRGISLDSIPDGLDSVFRHFRGLDVDPELNLIFDSVISFNEQITVSHEATLGQNAELYAASVAPLRDAYATGTLNSGVEHWMQIALSGPGAAEVEQAHAAWLQSSGSAELFELLRAIEFLGNKQYFESMAALTVASKPALDRLGPNIAEQQAMAAETVNLMHTLMLDQGQMSFVADQHIREHMQQIMAMALETGSFCSGGRRRDSVAILLAGGLSIESLIARGEAQSATGSTRPNDYGEANYGRCRDCLDQNGETSMADMGGCSVCTSHHVFRAVDAKASFDLMYQLAIALSEILLSSSKDQKKGAYQLAA